MTYTKHNNPKVDEVVGKDLKVIVDEVLKAIPKKDVEAIILVGGFGRGEGSVILEGGKITPINDYDLTIVTKRFRPEKLDGVSSKLSNDLGLRFVDLAYTNYYTMPFRGVIMLDYDSKYGGQVLYGDKDILDRYPRYKIGKMGFLEGYDLLCNRLIAPFELIKAHHLQQESHDLEVKLQIGRAIMAYYALLLINEDKYSHSYEERLVFINDVELEEKYKAVIRYATNLKLMPGEDGRSYSIKKMLGLAVDLALYTLARVHAVTDDQGIVRKHNRLSLRRVLAKGSILRPHKIYKPKYYEIELDVLKTMFMYRDGVMDADLLSKYDVAGRGDRAQDYRDLFSKLTQKWLKVHH